MQGKLRCISVTVTVKRPARAGNEGNVETYVNFTGFMWEAAEYFGALLVFVEVSSLVPCSCTVLFSPRKTDVRFYGEQQHRYYGKSMPFGAPVTFMNSLPHAHAQANAVTPHLAGADSLTIDPSYLSVEQVPCPCGRSALPADCHSRSASVETPLACAKCRRSQTTWRCWRS